MRPRPATALLCLPYLGLVLSPLLAVCLMASPRAVLAAVADPRYRGLLGDTALVGLAAAATAVAIGLPLALLTGRLRFAGSGLVRALAAGPILVPPTLIVVGWVFALGPERAPLVLYNRVAAGALLGAGLSPLVTVPAAAALDRLDPRLLEAARVGAGTRRRERGLLLGLLRGHALGGALLVFAIACTEHAALSFVFIDVAASEVAARMGGEFDAASAAAAAIPLGAMCGAAILAERLLARRGAAAAQDPGGDAPPPRLQPLGPLGTIAGLGAAVLFLGAGLLLPVGYLGRLAFSQQGAVARAVELGAPQLGRTLLIAAGAASVATVAAALAAAGLFDRRGPVAVAAEAAAVVPLGMAGAVTGTGLIALWNHRGPAWLPEALAPATLVYDTQWVLVHGHVARFAPLALLVALAGLRRVDPALLEAGRVCGLGPARRAWHIALPVAWPALAAGWLLVFALSAGEISASVLVAPPGRDTLPIALFNLLHFGRDADVAAMALLLLGVVLLPLMLAIPLWARLARARRRAW